MNRIWIIPTGDEIRNGVVRDLDSPMVMSEMLRIWPMAEIVRTAPVYDEMQEILNMLLSAREDGADLTVLIGGSGGGHRFSPTLGKDFSHSAMDVFWSRELQRDLWEKRTLVVPPCVRKKREDACDQSAWPIYGGKGCDSSVFSRRM